jgi:ribosomal protein L12E/L44/L45/RPP1/RPP2
MSIQITLEPQEINLVLAALGEVPLKNSLDTFFKIKAQAEQQFAAQQRQAADDAEQKNNAGTDTGDNS